MKKILEVLQYGEFDIRFNTDFNVIRNPEIVSKVICQASWAMVTTLWGGNERDVLAMIRALSIADLGVSVNRSDMIQFLDLQSKMVEDSMAEMREESEKKGEPIQFYPPGMCPMGKNS